MVFPKRLIWLITFVLASPGVFEGNRTSFKTVILYVLILSFFVAFRYEVGSDWLGYISYYYSGVAVDKASDQMEPLFMLVRYLCFWLGLPHTIFFYVMSVFSMLVICFAAKRFQIKNYYVVFLVYISLFICSFQFNLIRNGAMASCSWQAFSYKADKNWKMSLLWAVVASCFHLSGLIILPMIFIIDKVISKKVILFLMAVAAICFIVDLGGTILSYFPILAFIDRLNSYMQNDDLKSYGLSLGMIFNIAFFVYVFEIVS